MKTALSPVAELSFDESESILYVKMIQDAALNLVSAKQHGIQIEELTEGKPYMALIDTTNFFTIDDEALKYAGIPSKLEKRIAAAYYNPDLANWLTVKVFKRTSGLAFPVQIFKTKEKAVEWLSSFKNQDL